MMTDLRFALRQLPRGQGLFFVFLSFGVGECSGSGRGIIFE